MGMVIRKAPDIRYSEVTPKHLYLNRRRFLVTAAAAAGVAAAGAATGQVLLRRFSVAASRAREFNPGHAPYHRGIGVTPPGLGRENPGG